MAYFALYGAKEPLRAKDIAKEVSIPVFYLSKILRRMVEAGLLSATKGHGGGFLIAKPPSKISFADILEAIEGDISEPVCVFGWDACSDKSPCILHEHWKQMRHSFHAWANRTTLSDVKEGIDNLPNYPGKPLKERVRR
jgi:Rrf2 family protein